jgi:hypothetical protein
MAVCRLRTKSAGTAIPVLLGGKYLMRLGLALLKLPVEKLVEWMAKGKSQRQEDVIQVTGLRFFFPLRS